MPSNSNHFQHKANTSPEHLIKINELRDAYNELIDKIISLTRSNDDRYNAIKALGESLRLAELSTQGYNILTPSIVADAFASKEAKNEIVRGIWMNPMTYSGVRKFGRDILNISTDASSLKVGLIGTIWGAAVRVSKTIPDDCIVLDTTGEADYLTTAPDESELYRY